MRGFMMRWIGLTLWCLLAPLNAWASSGAETPRPMAWQVGQGTLTRQAVLKDSRGSGSVVLSCFSVDGTAEKLLKIIIRHRGLQRRLQATKSAQLRIFNLRTLVHSNPAAAKLKRIALRTFTPDGRIWSVLSPSMRSLTAGMLGAGFIDLVPTLGGTGGKAIQFGPVSNPGALRTFMRDCN